MFGGGQFYEDESESDMHLIDTNLYLGSVEASRGKERLQREGITHILGLLDSFRYYEKVDNITYMQIEIPDYYNQNIVKHLPETLKFISNALKTGKVLIHCAAGVSRSASICIGYIMVSKNMGFNEAKEFVRSKRPYIWPNEGFQKQLSSINVNDYKEYLE